MKDLIVKELFWFIIPNQTIEYGLATKNWTLI